MNDIAKAIITDEDRQKAEARTKVDAFARELGYSLAELVDGDAKPKRASTPAKYRQPENPALTWSGRGAQTAAVCGGDGRGQSRRGHGHRVTPDAVAVSPWRQIGLPTAPALQEGCRPHKAESGS
jgi:hypothetical protein